MPDRTTTLPRYQMPLPVGAWDWEGIKGRAKGLVACLLLFSSLVVINGFQILSLVLWPFSRRAFRAFNRFCADQWWGWCVIASQKAYGVHLVTTGDDVPPKENVLIVANHQQMPDIVALMMLARTKGRLGDLKWFVKDILKYVPGVGWGMLFLDCVFLKRDWDRDQDTVRRTFAKFLKHRIPVWLISFSEGTRLTPAKLARSREFALKNGRKPPSHVLIPRTKGFVAAIQGLRGHLDAVYDVTIRYEKGLPTVWQFACGWARKIHMDVRRTPLSELPTEARALADWLLERFERKDALLAETLPG